jgi:hypothetical protein
VTLAPLAIIAVGSCNSTNCTAGATGVVISRMTMPTDTLFVVGYGVLPGTTYSIPGNGIVVTQPTVSDFGPTTTGIPSVTFTVAVSPIAALGPHTLLVTDGAGEMTAFPGGILITN